MRILPGPIKCLLSIFIVLLFSSLAFSGGPVCAPSKCVPVMSTCPPPLPVMPSCAPPMPVMPTCAPPVPVCGPPRCAPPMCPPPMCAPPACPPPACGPAYCPPPSCAKEDNCFTLLGKGACKLVVGVLSLPFKVVDCIFGQTDCGPRNLGRCAPYARTACMPPSCGPTYCAPPMPACGPAYGCGIGFGPSVGGPVGFGFAGPKRGKFVPFAEKKSLPASLIAGTPTSVFGEYW